MYWSSPEEYMRYQQTKYDIHVSSSNNDKSFNEEWWDGVTMSAEVAAQHKCKRCQEDNERFWKLYSLARMSHILKILPMKRKTKVNVDCVYLDAFGMNGFDNRERSNNRYLEIHIQ